jgi:hypothetical protein
MPKTPPLTGILTVTGRRPFLNIIRPSTNQLIDLGASTNQWKTFYTRRSDFRNAERDGTSTLTGRRDHLR